ncbi:MAG: chemotaxis protein CheW [Candidatus Tectimicrobiota bacterium]|nr:MAG: chemotaxis protein CheW [Candidatus Tectomicrobia bacterium]
MASTATPAASAASRSAGGKFLTFFLGQEEYGLEILKVQEIIGMLDITPVPRTPPFVRGVINLRGKVIPIIDLRRKFGMAAAQGEETCIVVVKAHGVETGLVVDRVSEVLDIAEEDVEAPPDFGAGVDTSFLLGIAKSDKRVQLLLDIDKVLATHEALTLSPSASQPHTPEEENR